MPSEAARAVREELSDQLVSTGERLTDAVIAAIIGRGREAVPGLIEILEDEELAREDAPGGGYAPIHAGTILREMKASEAIQPMLRVLARCDVEDILYSELVCALEALGAPVLEPALAAHAVAETEDQRVAVANILSGLGVRDDRVFAILLNVLEKEPELGAGLLAEYGDAAALAHLGAALDRCEVDDRGGLFANQGIVELDAAIEDLGGSLSEAQEQKVRAVKAVRNAARAPLLAIGGSNGEDQDEGEDEDEGGDGDCAEDQGQREREEVIEQFSRSPHAGSVHDLSWIDLALTYGAQYQGVSLAEFDARVLRHVLLELFPRKVSCEASEAPAIVRSLRAFWTFARDALGHAHAVDCLRALGDDAIPKLARRLEDPSNFGMAKSFVMMGRSRGFAVDSEEGLREWSQAFNGEEAFAHHRSEPPERDRAEGRRKKKLRKLRKQAQRRNRR